MNAFEVIQRGALTTIQDLGRLGYLRYGVSICGAMDSFALRVGNLLVGNANGGEAGLEATVVGPKLRVLTEIQVAFTGADLSPEINGHPVPMWCRLKVTEGDRISFGLLRSGCRAYICASGGIDIPLTMGSRSTHIRTGLGGFGRPLEQGDIIPVKDRDPSPESMGALNPLPSRLVPGYSNLWTVRVVLGPQADYFTPRGLETFLRGEYVITAEADRMGYRLQGPKIEHQRGADIITDATPPGSVQVPGDGNPIILMADAQTTGGYPKIGVVISPDQNRLGQAKPGDRVRFTKVEVVEAHRLLLEMEKTIQEIRGFLSSAY